MEKGTGMLLIAGACVLVLLIGSIKNRMEWMLNFGIRTVMGGIAICLINSMLSGRTWTGQSFDIWNPRIQRSFFTLRSVSFSSFVSFC